MLPLCSVRTLIKPARGSHDMHVHLQQQDKHSNDPATWPKQDSAAAKKQPSCGVGRAVEAFIMIEQRLVVAQFAT